MGWKGIDTLAVVQDYALGRSMRAVALAHGCTAGYVSRLVKAAGVGARSRTREAAVRPPCRRCGKPARERYCSPGCYYASIYNPSYVQWRQGQRVARATVVASGFPLTAEQVVHHADGDDRNNRLENLWVFATRGHHMSFHRLGREMIERRAVWKGGVVVPE
jgi:hypothetical protein